MACVRKRRGKWVADGRDQFGRRFWITKDTRREAEAALAEKLRTVRGGRRARLDPDTTLAAFVPYWLELVAARDVDPATVVSYERVLRMHVLPVLGDWKVRQIDEADLLTLLTNKLTTNALRRSTVKFLLAVVRSLFNRAVKDRLLDRNPAAELGGELRLGRSRADKEEVKALTRPERDHLLATSRRERPRLYAPVLVMTHAGLRIGEVAGLEWTDVDLDPVRRTLTARRTFTQRVLKSTTKSGAARTVPLTPQLREVLVQHRLEQRKAALRRGWGEMPAWVFCSATGGWLDVRECEDACKRMVAKAGLPPHHTPHSCRHTFATLLLRAGVPVEYVKRRLGHASIAMTADLYGAWLPESDEPAWTPKPGQSWVDVLDTAANGSNLVADAANGSESMTPRGTSGSASA